MQVSSTRIAHRPVVPCTFGCCHVVPLSLLSPLIASMTIAIALSHVHFCIPWQWLKTTFRGDRGSIVFLVFIIAKKLPSITTLIQCRAVNQNLISKLVFVLTCFCTDNNRSIQGGTHLILHASPSRNQECSCCKPSRIQCCQKA